MATIQLTNGNSPPHSDNGVGNIIIGDSTAGGTGNDIIDGNDGNDTIYGDIQPVSSVPNTINGGTDDLDGGNGNDHIFAGGGNDTIYGNQGDTAGTDADTIAGDGGNDDIFSHGGNDLVYGDAGASGFYNRGTPSSIFDSPYDPDVGGDDEIFSGAGNDTVLAGGGNDYVEDTVGNNNLSGDGGDDTVISGNGNDTIFGYKGDDLLASGFGDDRFFQNELGNVTIADAGGSDDRIILNFSLLSPIGLFYDVTEASADLIITVNDDNTNVISIDDYFLNTDRIEWLDDDTLAALNGDEIYLPDIAGTFAADTLNGSAGDDLRIGFSGNDLINGGVGGNDSGADFLDGSSGNDTISGGEGNDTIFGGSGTDSLAGGNSNDFVFGDAGNDTVVAGAGADYTDLGAGADIFVVDVSLTGVMFTSGDTITGNADTVAGDTEIDTIEFSGGVSLTTGALANVSGIDKLKMLGTGGQSVTLTDAFVASALGQHVALEFNTSNTTGVTANASLLTSPQSVTVTTGLGNDTITAGGGNDTISSDGGTDRIIFAATSLTSSDSVVGGSGSDTLHLTGSATLTESAFDKIYGIDVFTFANSSGWNVSVDRDPIMRSDIGTSATFDFSAVSVGGIVFNGLGINSSTYGATIYGGSSSDTITGGFGIDYISGLNGNDSIKGDGSADTIDGGNGNDIILGEASADVLNGDADNDSISGGTNNDTITGGSGNDTILGNDSNDSLDGGADTDTVSYAGGAGVTVSLASGTASGQGTDTLANFENVTGSSNADSVTGSSTANILSTASGADTVSGGGGDDTLSGGNDNDILDGGAGVDALTGGAGADSFKFSSLADSPLTDPDRIIDFSQDTTGGGVNRDIIDLSGLGFSSIQAGSSSGDSILGYTFNDASDRTYITNTNQSFRIILENTEVSAGVGITLTAADFDFT